MFAIINHDKYMKVKVLIVLPNCLFEKSKKILREYDRVYIVEHPHFFTRYSFHKKKLILHRASMKSYFTFCENALGKDKVKYVEFHEIQALHEDCRSVLVKSGIQGEVHVIDPIESDVRNDITQMFNKPIKISKASVKIRFIRNHLFLYDKTALDAFHQLVIDDKRVAHSKFYKWSLENHPRLNALIDRSLDSQNRKVYSGPKVFKVKNNRSSAVQLARQYVEEHFKSNYGGGGDGGDGSDGSDRVDAGDGVDAGDAGDAGDAEAFIYPIDHRQAKKWLVTFVKERLKYFGDYQDSINPDDPYLYHSILSSSLNIGLITPKMVIEVALRHYESNDNERKMSKNNFEGFIRQIIGWREYMRYVYEFHEDDLVKSNVLQLHKKLNKSWWTGHTPLEPVNMVIKQTLGSCYMSHIQRLMIVLNAMILSEIRPRDIVKWFTEMSIDAYDWVMISNIYAMGGFNDRFMSRPYISSSRYLVKMGHPRGDWEERWNDLYSKFICKKKHVKSLKFYSHNCK